MLPPFHPLLAVFGYPLMLGWLAVAAAPLVIHLLSRRKYREMSWAAMTFLVAALRKNSRRIQVEQWLLLAIRTLIIVLIVFALSEPYLETMGLETTAGEHIHKLIVLDGSYSMAFKPTDKSRFDRAKDLAYRIVDESVQGDGFTLVLMGSPPRAVVATPAFEPRDFRAEIENLRLPHGGADLPATMTLVERLIDQAEKEHSRFTHHQVFFLSDLGRNTWSVDAAGPAGVDFVERSKRLASRAALQVIDLGQDAAPNTAVTRFALADPYATSARDVTFEADIRNFSTERRDSLLAELYVDGRRVAEDQLAIDGSGETTVAFPYRFDTPGQHLAELRLGNDLLEIDNHRWFAADVREHLKVLCINGRPSGGDLRGATDYLTVALQPRSDEVDRPLVRVEVAAESALGEFDLSTFDCVFLCNVAQFTTHEASVLSGYLRQGGGVVFFLGDQVNTDNYNRMLATAEENRPAILPAQLGEVVPQGLYFFNPLDYRHPIVDVFRDQEQAGLLTTPVQRYVKLDVKPEQGSRVALAFANGDAAIVEQPVGRGRAVVVATSADLSWTTMPVWPSYLPIVQELLAWAVQGKAGEQNVIVGAAFGKHNRQLAGQPSVTVRSSSGDSSTIRLTAGVDPGWSFVDTLFSGAYTATYPGTPPREEFYAVNVDTAESDLTRLDAAELRDQVWAGVRFTHRTNWQNLTEEDDGAISRRNTLHQVLLAIAFALMIVETSLASWFGRRSR